MFEAFLLFFAFGTFWFWALSAAVFVAVLAFSENEHNIVPVFIIAAFAYIMNANGSFAIFSDPFALLGWVAMYFGIGAGWSVLKWFSYLHKRGDEFAKYKLTYIKKHNVSIKDKIGDYRVELEEDVGAEIPYPISVKFRDYLESSGYVGYGKDKDIVPDWRNNKERMTTWILYWPTSALWTLLNDPLVRLAKWIYQRLGGIYDGLTQRVFGKFGDMSRL